jgi:tripartite-type tricarboxylate transporter receptor subunit TctC
VSLATTAVMSGEVQLSMVPVTVALAQAKAGKVKAFAITSRNRFAGAADVPRSPKRAYPDSKHYVVRHGGAGKTAAELGRKLNTDMVEIIGSPAAREWLLKQGAEPSPGTTGRVHCFS